MVPSVRNSLSMNLSLLKTTNCDKIFYSQELEQKVQELREERPSVIAIPMPSLDELLESSPKHYPYIKHFEEVEDDPIIIVHTSGSTGKVPQSARSFTKHKSQVTRNLSRSLMELRLVGMVLDIYPKPKAGRTWTMLFGTSRTADVSSHLSLPTM